MKLPTSHSRQINRMKDLELELAHENSNHPLLKKNLGNENHTSNVFKRISKLRQALVPNSQSPSKKIKQLSLSIHKLEKTLERMQTLANLNKKSLGNHKHTLLRVSNDLTKRQNQLSQELSKVALKHKYAAKNTCESLRKKMLDRTATLEKTNRNLKKSNCRQNKKWWVKLGKERAKSINNISGDIKTLQRLLSICSKEFNKQRGTNKRQQSQCLKSLNGWKKSKEKQRKIYLKNQKRSRKRKDDFKRKKCPK